MASRVVLEEWRGPGCVVALRIPCRRWWVLHALVFWQVRFHRLQGPFAAQAFDELWIHGLGDANIFIRVQLHVAAGKHETC